MQEQYQYVDENGNPVNNQDSGNYPPIQQLRSDKADLIDKIKPDVIVEILRHRLMGEELVNGEWVINDRLKENSISYAGAHRICTLMLSCSSQNVALSKIDDSIIRARAIAISRCALEECLANWREWNIKNASTLNFIHQIVFSNTFITLKQPEHGGIRALIMGTTQESIIHNQDRGKSSIWPFKR